MNKAKYLYPILGLVQDELKFNIKCPICSDDFVHHNSETIVVDGRDSYRADPSVRGDVIIIPMWCENGDHKFSMKIGQHKGQITMWFTDQGNKYFSK